MFVQQIVLLALLFCLQSLADKIPKVGNTFGSEKNKRILSEELYNKIYSYTKNSRVFSNLTLEETIKIVNGIETWDDPFNLKELLPYNLTGYDYEKRPVWMVDAGKLDFPNLAKKGQKAWATLEVFTVQAFLRAMKRPCNEFEVVDPFDSSAVTYSLDYTAALDSSSDEIREGLFVYDMETFRMEQLNHLQVLAEILRIVQKYNDLSLQLVGGIIILNSNYATQVAVSLVRPLVGRLMEKVEIYGNNRNIWLPRLLKHFSVDILPPQYGGSTNFKPLAEYG